MELTYKEDYFNNQKFKKEFIRFLNQIHNLDLTKWNESGYWDSNYYPFSYFDKNKIVSNVSLYSIDMIIDGDKQKVAQISSVGTDSDYRKRGLSSNLLEKALEFAHKDHKLIFLFADKEAQRLYQKFGFKHTLEYIPAVNLEKVDNSGQYRKLYLSNPDDLIIIERLITSRDYISNKIGHRCRNLLYFWLIYFLSDTVFYIDDLDCLILMKQEDKILTIFDIISNKLPEFDILKQYIVNKSINQIQFRFMIDKLNIENIELLEIDNGLHLSENFSNSIRNLIFPHTVQA